MSTRKITKGVSNRNPNVASAGAGSGVADPPSAPGPSTPSAPTAPAASPATTATTPLTAGEWYTVEAALKRFRVGFVPLLAALEEVLLTVSTGDQPLNRAVTQQNLEVARQYAGLLHQFPSITTEVDPNVIDAGLAVNAAIAMVKSDLEQALPAVETCGRRAAYVSWSESKIVRNVAKAMPHKPTMLEAKIASIEALLHQGKRVTSTAGVAAKAQATATKSAQRAARAAAKATKAAEVAARAALVHAERHPQATPDVVIVPAGSTPPTTPPATPPATPPTGTTPKG